jgi:8-oxo-dGTP diphosphatase
MEKRRPKVGVGVIVINNGKVLLGTRKGSHGDGSWCFPGGHLEFNEKIEECAKRETMEETGIKIKNIKKIYFTNDIFPKEKVHFVTLYVVSDYDSGEVKVMEPEKCDKWDWFNWDKLPKPLFIPIENLLKENFNPFDC